MISSCLIGLASSGHSYFRPPLGGWMADRASMTDRLRPAGHYWTYYKLQAYTQAALLPMHFHDEAEGAGFVASGAAKLRLPDGRARQRRLDVAAGSSWHASRGRERRLKPYDY